MMIWLVGAVLILLSAYVATRHRRRMRQFENLEESALAPNLQALFETGYDGALMVFRDMGSERFVQFRKYIIEPGRMGIETQFPAAPWSKLYYDAVVELCRKHGLPFERLSTDTTPTTEFLRVDFGDDVRRAAFWAGEVFRLVYGCEEVRISVRASDLNPKGERVERRDHPRPIDYLLNRTTHRGST